MSGTRQRVGCDEKLQKSWQRERKVRSNKTVNGVQNVTSVGPKCHSRCPKTRSRESSHPNSTTARHNSDSGHSRTVTFICGTTPIHSMNIQSDHRRCRGRYVRPHLLTADATSMPITSSVSPPLLSESPSCTNKNTSPTLVIVKHLYPAIYALVLCLVACFRAHPLIPTRRAEPPLHAATYQTSTL